MQNQVVLPKAGTRRGFTFTPETIGIGAAADPDLDAAKTQSVRQNFIDRVRAYIPLEVLAFFIFVNSTISDDTDEVAGGAPTLIRDGFNGMTGDDFVALASVAVSVAAIFVFTKAATKSAGTGRWVLQSLVSVAAFLVWSYAIRAEVFYVVGVPFQASVSGFLLGTFTLFSGFLVPVERPDDRT